MINYVPHEAPITEANNLPIRPTGVPIGRDDELRSIYVALQNNRTVWLSGEGGMGKTTLAGAIAMAFIQADVPVVWLNLYERPLADILNRLGRAYEIQQITELQNPVEAIDLAARLLREEKPLLVLDGRHDAVVTAEFLRRCADDVPVLVVAEGFVAGDWEHIALGSLQPDDARLMFHKRAGMPPIEDDTAVAELCELLGGVPIYIAMAARGMLASKQDPRAYLQSLYTVMEKQSINATTGVLTLNHFALNKSMQALVLLIAATPYGEISLELLSRVSRATPEAISKTMRALANLYVVDTFNRNDETYYQLHSVVHDFAQNILSGSDRAEQFRNIVRDDTLAYLDTYTHHDTRSESRVATEMDAIVGLVLQDDANTAETAAQITTSLNRIEEFIDDFGYRYDANVIEAVQAAVNGWEATVLDDRDDEDDEIPDFLEQSADEWEAVVDEPDTHSETELEPDSEEVISQTEQAFATDTTTLQKLDMASLQSERKRAQEQNNELAEIAFIKAIGVRQVKNGENEAAIATFNELLTTCEMVGDDEHTLEALDLLSSLLVNTGSPHAAILHTNRGIELAKKLNKQLDMMYINMTLGNARQALGEHEEAVEAYTAAIKINRDFDDKQNEGLALYHVGFAHLDLGEVDAAIDDWTQAAALFKSQKKDDEEGLAYAALGSAYAEQGEWEYSLRNYTKALPLIHQANHAEDELNLLQGLANASLQSEQLSQALLHYRQALHLAYEANNPQAITEVTSDIVRLMMRSMRLLSICELLVDHALTTDPNSSELQRLREEITAKIEQASLQGLQQAPVAGTAQDYAANAYQLLDQTE